ncbi:MAG: hypothetical protein ACHQ7M_20465, partial [Chloroflexota bacterium]
MSRQSDNLPGDIDSASSPEAAEADVAKGTGSEASTQVSLSRGSLMDRDPDTGDALHSNIAPNSQATPVGDTAYAGKANDLADVEGQRRQLSANLESARQWLINTAQGDKRDPQGDSWEDVVGVPKGSDPNSASVAYQQSRDPNDFSSKLSTSSVMQGPGTESTAIKHQFDDGVTSLDPRQADRQQIVQYMQSVQKQLDALDARIHGTGGGYGSPEAQRGLEHGLDDFAARQQLDPATLEAQRQSLMQSSTSKMSGLSKKQETLAERRAGAQDLSSNNTIRRAGDSRYSDRGMGSDVDGTDATGDLVLPGENSGMSTRSTLAQGELQNRLNLSDPRVIAYANRNGINLRELAQLSSNDLADTRAGIRNPQGTGDPLEAD